jgi:UDP-N-acetylglucosamine 2-epimerase (non-hydrolysing)
MVDERITVAEFENKKPKCIINLVFDDGNPFYPYSNLSLEGKTIIVSY